MANGIPIIDANCVFGFWPHRKADVAISALIQTAQSHGIARSIALSTTGIFHDFRIGNDETLAAVQANPQALFPVATIDPRQHLDCAAEIELRAGQGFRLVRFFPEYQGWPLVFAPFREVLSKLEEKKINSMVSVSGLGQATQLSDMVALNQTPLILSGVTYSNLGEVIAIMKSDPKIHLETHRLNSPDAFEVLAAEVGCDRLVFGSYSPLKYVSSALQPVLMASLTDEQKAAILSGNIRRLFAAQK